MSDEKDKKTPEAPERSSSIERAIASKGASSKPSGSDTPVVESSAEGRQTPPRQAADPDVAKWAKPDAESATAQTQTEPAKSDTVSKRPDSANQGDKVPGDKISEQPAQKSTAEAADEPSDNASAKTPTAAPKAPKAKSGGGRGLAWLSLLLALGAAGGAGYLYYELVYLKPFDRQLAGQMNTVQQTVDSATAAANEDTRELAQQFAGLEERFAALRGEQSSAIDGALTQQQQRLETTERSLMESLNKVANQAPPSQEEWKLAELEYLLRIANHRVLMEQDADGARRLLETADAIVAELDDFGLHDVRVQLADEILSLKRLGKNDVQGLFLRLEAVKRGLDGLPLRVPEYLNNPPDGATPEQAGEQRGALAAFADSMGTFLQFRKLETKIKPLLAPDEISYLELNLRLMLEQAQLGALRGQPDVFEQSLDNAMDWLTRYLDADSTAVTEMVDELAALREISVVRELPDISGSLRALLATERTAS